MSFRIIKLGIRALPGGGARDMRNHEALCRYVHEMSAAIHKLTGIRTGGLSMPKLLFEDAADEDEILEKLLKIQNNFIEVCDVLRRELSWYINIERPSACFYSVTIKADGKLLRDDKARDHVVSLYRTAHMCLQVLTNDYNDRYNR